MIKCLYDASRDGVKIRIIVRGTCALIPGVKGMSENIEAISIVDKYLEHSRIYVFYNQGEELYFISSADWMTRNLDHRIEVTCPVKDKNLQKELRRMMDIQWSDNVKARVMDETQQNEHRTTGSKEAVRSQDAIYKYLKQLNP